MRAALASSSSLALSSFFILASELTCDLDLAEEDALSALTGSIPHVCSLLDFPPQYYLGLGSF